jgi:plastocyanin
MIKQLLAKALMIVTLFVTVNASAQTTHTITVAPGGALSYSPSRLNCTIGDTVRFFYGPTSSGTHPTVSTSGPVSIASHTLDTTNNEFKVAMTATGTVNYECVPHAGSGMVGTIIVNAAPNLTGCNELFFSEYIEGSSNNKAIEIYNPSSTAINMNGYSVRLFANGSATAGNVLNLPNRTLAAGDVYVIANSSANASILAVDDTTSNVTFYNGDDAIGYSMVLHRLMLLVLLVQTQVQVG